ncbi:hypothetical protein CS022_01660 [Veronia nyctiphanis]|uniref:Uncharacterized protein n=1 Tax=Veronia nyctiphanis TaxID=1278244 RepID=A0A4V1LTE5_9GAMM|nr:hypothetical protein [Veronia nyctiphanis]RXJ74918.1 hypothetical protein CS022_01660 [Veronia nyctiphanis]
MLVPDRVKRKDNYLAAFQKANTALTLKLSALKDGKPGICKLKELISASDDLADVCSHFDDELKHYELLIWLHHQISLYYRSEGIGPGLQLICRVEAQQIAERIRMHGIYLSGDIIPFIEVLKPIPIKKTKP